MKRILNICIVCIIGAMLSFSAVTAAPAEEADQEAAEGIYIDPDVLTQRDYVEGSPLEGYDIDIFTERSDSRQNQYENQKQQDLSNQLDSLFLGETGTYGKDADVSVQEELADLEVFTGNELYLEEGDSSALVTAVFNIAKWVIFLVLLCLICWIAIRISRKLRERRNPCR